MSDDKKRWPHAEALAVAKQLQDLICPACEQIAIAGSLRRMKPFVGDIELLFVPRYTERPEGLFENRIVDVADEVIEKLFKDGIIAKRPNIRGSFTWGVSNKLAIHVASGIPVDLFSTYKERWWVSLVVRTGSKETNLRLTNGAIKLGRSLNAYGQGVTIRKTGEVIPALSEEQVFSLCGIPYLEPTKR